MHYFKEAILCFLVFAGILAGKTNVAFARWATHNDAEIEIEQLSRIIYINKEGIANEIYETRLKPLTKNSIASLANYTYAYNSKAMNLKIVEAYTLNKKKKYPVNVQKIKRQAISDTRGNPNNQTQIIIPYPNCKIGSTLHLKYKSLESAKPIKKFYSNYFSFGNQNYMHSARICVVSELPLYVSINDPEKLLDIKKYTQKKEKKTLYCLKIYQKKPIYKNIIDEGTFYFNLKDAPLVAIEAMPSLAHYHKVNINKYLKIKNAPLPTLYQKIATTAKAQPNIINKIDTVTALLHKNLKYFIDPKIVTSLKPSKK